MKPCPMIRIIDRVRYSTETATLLAANDWWDGHNYERRGTNRFLYRTPHGRYFFFNRTQWQGGQDEIMPCPEGEAIEFFERTPEHCQRVPYEQAFPDVQVEDA